MTGAPFSQVRRTPTRRGFGKCTHVHVHHVVVVVVVVVVVGNGGLVLVVVLAHGTYTPVVLFLCQFTSTFALCQYQRGNEDPVSPVSFLASEARFRPKLFVDQNEISEMTRFSTQTPAMFPALALPCVLTFQTASVSTTTPCSNLGFMLCLTTLPCCTMLSAVAAPAVLASPSMPLFADSGFVQGP